MLGQQMTELAGPLLAVQLIVAIGVYAWVSAALMAVFSKAGEPRWKAWVPVVNLWTLFELAGMRGWWAAVIGAAVVVVGGAATVIGGALTAAALSASFGGDAAGAQSTMLAAIAVPAVLWLVLAVGVIVLEVRMLVGVNRRFGLGVAYTVVGVIAFPVWASIVGWGSARWLRAPNSGALGGAGASPSVDPAFSLPLSPAPSVAPPLVDFSATPKAPAAFSDVPAFSAVPPPAAAFAGAAGPTTAAARPAHNPWAPPVVTPANPTSAASVSAAPASAVGPSAAEALSPSAPPASDLEDHTMLAGPRQTGWSLVLPGGATLSLTRETAVLGRNPLAPPRAPDAQVIAVDDVTRTVSKTHALLSLGTTGWTITDLDSTNGVFIGASPDSAAEVVGTASVDGPFLLGDAALSLRPDGPEQHAIRRRTGGGALQ